MKLFLMLVAGSLNALAQVVPATPPAPPTIPLVPPISSYTPAVPSSVADTPPLTPQRSEPSGLSPRHFFGPYGSPHVPQLYPGSADRIRSLVRGGKLYLSERDAIALAIENNLDVEIERYNLVLADTDKLRAAGGGNLRGIDFTIQEPPNGVGGPGSPLLNASATNPNPITPTVTDLTSLNANTQQQTDLSGSSTATAQYATGPSIPLFDPNLFLASGYLRRSDTTALIPSALGTSGNQEPLDFLAANVSYMQGFRYSKPQSVTIRKCFTARSRSGTRSRSRPPPSH